MSATATPCPECGADAEITERFVLPSTDGPVDHVALSCVAGHHLKMAADRLAIRVVVPASLELDRSSCHVIPFAS